VAKALNIADINCPDLKVGAIENLTVSGLLPQAFLRGAQNQPVFGQGIIIEGKIKPFGFGTWIRV
jgi:hypothetical protein